MKKEITQNTLVDYPRLEKLVEFYNQTRHLSGDIAEVGVYKGGTAYLLCERALAHNDHVYLFDTFKGMPKVSDKDLHHKGDFADTSVNAVIRLLGSFRNYAIYMGKFPQDTGYTVEQFNFKLVHLDCDIYESVKDSLELFWPKMVPGGIIVFDDYNEPNCPGAKLAVREFFKDNPEKIVETVQSQAIVVK